MQRRSKFTFSTAATTVVGGTPTEQKPDVLRNSLQLQSKLKEIMCTNLCMSGNDAGKLFAQASEN